jgi:hypothetical protein
MPIMKEKNVNYFSQKSLEKFFKNSNDKSKENA